MLDLMPENRNSKCETSLEPVFDPSSRSCLTQSFAMKILHTNLLYPTPVEPTCKPGHLPWHAGLANEFSEASPIYLFCVFLISQFATCWSPNSPAPHQGQMDTTLATPIDTWLMQRTWLIQGGASPRGRKEILPQVALIHLGRS